MLLNWVKKCHYLFVLTNRKKMDGVCSCTLKKVNTFSTTHRIINDRIENSIKGRRIGHCTDGNTVLDAIAIKIHS